MSPEANFAVYAGSVVENLTQTHIKPNGPTFPYVLYII